MNRFVAVFLLLLAYTATAVVFYHYGHKDGVKEFSSHRLDGKTPYSQGYSQGFLEASYPFGDSKVSARESDYECEGERCLELIFPPVEVPDCLGGGPFLEWEFEFSVQTRSLGPDWKPVGIVAREERDGVPTDREAVCINVAEGSCVQFFHDEGQFVLSCMRAGYTYPISVLCRPQDDAPTPRAFRMFKAVTNVGSDRIRSQPTMEGKFEPAHTPYHEWIEMKKEQRARHEEWEKGPADALAVWN